MAHTIKVPVSFMIEVDIEPQIAQLKSGIEAAFRDKFDQIITEVRGQVNEVADFMLQEGTATISTLVERQINQQVCRKVADAISGAKVEKAAKAALASATKEAVAKALAEQQ